MEKFNFKFGLFLGVLLLLNFTALCIHLYIIASGNASFMNIINGCIHVYCMFLYGMWCSEVLDQDEH